MHSPLQEGVANSGVCLQSSSWQSAQSDPDLELPHTHARVSSRVCCEEGRRCETHQLDQKPGDRITGMKTLELDVSIMIHLQEISRNDVPALKYQGNYSLALRQTQLDNPPMSQCPPLQVLQVYHLTLVGHWLLCCYGLFLVFQTEGLHLTRWRLKFGHCRWISLAGSHPT
jgi:hypothetical protein